MPWSGSGTYSLPPAYSPEVNGTTIDAARYNGLTSDVASGITAALAKNGENVPTANLPMGGFKHTGAADASATGQYIAFNQVTAVGSLTITALTVTSATGERFIVTGSTVPANGIYLSAANTLAFASNTTQRALVSAIGGWTFKAPTSGTTITANVFSGGQNAINSVAGAATTDYALNLFTGATVTGFTGIGNSAVVNTALRNAMGIGTQTAHDFVVMTNNTEKARISSAGNVTITAPSSGVALAATGVSGSPAFKSAGGAYTVSSTQVFSATPTFDASASNYFEMAAMTANVTSVTISNPTPGQTITIRFVQDGTGSRTVASPSGAKISGVVGATASAASFLTLTYTSASRWEGAWTQLPA